LPIFAPTLEELGQFEQIHFPKFRASCCAKKLRRIGGIVVQDSDSGNDVWF
jgi:hypothetical protein